MVAYEDYVKLCGSRSSEDRGQAAHYAAYAFITHDGPPDEQAALYATLINFLDDSSVKVRAALAYGLLHSDRAPRPIIIALLQDSAIISRAVAQYSPVLLETDLVAAIATADLGLLTAIAARPKLGRMTAKALLAQDCESVTLAVLARDEIRIDAEVLAQMASNKGHVASIRGELLSRNDLPAEVRMDLVDQTRKALLGARLVKGSIAPRRLERLMRDASDTAMTAIGENESGQNRAGFADKMVRDGRVSARTMLHALVCGRVMFFAACLARLAEMPREKVFGLLDRGSRVSLNALLARCGFGEAQRNLVARLIVHARSADLADDLAARYFVVTVIIEEIIIEYDGVIPSSLTELFTYLNDQNIVLARKAARGVMASFAEEVGTGRNMPLPEYEQPMALPAA